MKKRIFGMLLMGAMVIASVSMFTSCKDYDDDINKLQSEIDAITAQKLQDQLTTLQNALTTAQSAADAAKAAAATAQKTAEDADAAAKLAQGSSSGAAAAAQAAQATADAADAAAKAAQATADAAAKAQTVEDLSSAIDDLKKIIDGKVSAADVDAAIAAAIAEVEKKIVAISEDLLTIDDVKKLLADEGFAKEAVVKDLESQIKALETLVKNINVPDPVVDEAWKKNVEDAIASLTQIKKDIASKADKTTVEELKKSVDKAVAAMAKVDSFADSINSLNVFAKRNLRSINLSPAKFYGGIEAVDIFAFTPKEEKMNDQWHYFKRGSNVTLSEIGYADYHISPKSVDLTNFAVNFFTRSSDIIEPATTEKTRAVTNTNRLKPVYNNTDSLIKYKNWNAGTGILTVPYKVDNAVAIANELKAGKGTIAALQLSKDSTVTSDYALVVPTISELLLITDKSFASMNTGRYWNDVPGLNNGAVNNYHLHRNFSYLAISKTTATHEIVYNESFNISEVLGIHAIDPEIVTVTKKAQKDMDKNIQDTAEIVLPERATAKRYNYDPTYDSDATLLKTKCTALDAAKLKELGLYFDVHRVGYSLGTTGTEESNHIEILQNEDGDFIAYPRNINASNGETITGKTANVAAVGRMPIVCIELKYQKGNKPAATDPTVTFAYMKFLIVKGTTPVTVKEAEFEVSDVWADCGEVSGEVKWYQIEGKVYDEKLGMDKEEFDKKYVFDFYKEVEKVDEIDRTQAKDVRYGYRFKKNSKGEFTHDKDSIGQVAEEWNISTQGKLDATTHIIKWYFTTADYVKVYKDLKAKGKLAYDWKSGQMTNTVAIDTWVRYAYKSSYHKGNMDVTDGDPALYIKLTIPVGKFHFALGSLGGTKTLTYWYKLAPEAEVNAPDRESAREVRVNVPVPVPDAKKSVTSLSALNCPWNEALKITNDNLLERTEFLKDLHDYFRNGKLEAAVTDKTHFKKLANAKITPEFKFTVPSTKVGNASFSANASGEWNVTGISGKKYTLKLYANDTQIRISPYTVNDILCSITKDDNGILSVIKYHEGVAQDDILNYKKHNELGELETFTAYIMIDTPDACAPIEFDDMWFNVRFLRPCDLGNPQPDILPDAPNDWQYVDIAKYARVYDWRDYLCDPQNRIGGNDIAVDGYKVDFKYYQISLNTDEQLFLTDAGLGTSERDPNTEKDNYKNAWDINSNSAYKAKLWKTAEVNGLLVQKVDGDGATSLTPGSKSTWIRYKNNSGVTGGFHIYVPIQMTYVFGNYPQTTQQKYVALSISKSVAQVQE